VASRPHGSRNSPAYERRNARARSLGYRSYYDYRIHGNGSIPPAAAAATGEARQRLRGHRSAADLRRAIREGTTVSIAGHSERDSNGQYRWLELSVLSPDGSERTYRLTGKQLQKQQLGRLVGELDHKGAAFAPTPSFDLRRLG
jgi:hypothetical protein